MLNGENAPHRPTLITVVVLLAIVLLAYHFATHRKG